MRLVELNSEFQKMGNFFSFKRLKNGFKYGVFLFFKFTSI